MKKYIKKILGDNISSKIGIIKKYLMSIPKILSKQTLKISSKKIERVEIYELKNKNVFCGYYDLKPIQDNKILVHVCKKNSNTKSDEIELGYFNMDTKNYVKIINTKAWSWQQGSRLRWSNIEKNVIYYNDVENEKYCMKKYDIEKNETLQVVPYPIYDMDYKEEYGVTVNFSRLQRLRPGYGYNYLEDVTVNQKAPEDDGVFAVNLKTNESKLLISLKELAELVDKELEFEHYINHISLSPEGDKIMFFHLWTKPGVDMWNNELCVINIDGSGFKVLEDKEKVSHYDWKNNNELLITGVKQNKEEFYRYYNTDTLEKTDVIGKNLKRDGHPIHSLDKCVFYSDTYPDNKTCMQNLFEYNMKNKEYTLLLEAFANPRLVGEKRCDLHPKFISKENVIIIDSTFKKCKRNLVLIKIKSEN